MMMTNSKKLLSYMGIVSCLGVFTLLSSCIDESYDLNKDISLEVNIGGAELGLPIGSTANIELSQLIELDETFKMIDGKYAVSKADTIKDIKVPAIDGITIGKTDIQIAPIELDFTMGKIPAFEIPEQSINPTDGLPAFDEPDINIDPISVEVPLGNIAAATIPKAMSLPVITVNKSIGISYGCQSLPTDVSKVNDIVFGSTTTPLGTLISFNFDADKLVIDGFSADVKNFTITVPSHYHIAANPASPATVTGNSIRFEDIKTTNKTFSASFYLKKLTLNKTGGFSVQNESISYSFDFTASYSKAGSIQASTPKFAIKAEPKKDILQVFVNTKEKSFNIQSATSSISTQIGVPEQLTKVNYITFNTTGTNSELTLKAKNITLPTGMALSGDIKIQFPNTIHVTGAGVSGTAGAGTTGAGTTGQTLTTPINTLMTTGVTAKITRIDVEKEVVNKSVSFSADVVMKAATLKLAASNNIDVKSLDMTQKIEVAIAKATMDVKDATFEYKEYIANIQEQKEKINIKESIPSEVTEINKVNLADGVTAKLDIIVRNVPKNAALRFNNYKIKFPDYIIFEEITGLDPSTNTLTLNDYFTDKTDNLGGFKNFTKELKFKSLKFGNSPITTENGKQYIDLSASNVILTGGFSIDKGQLTSGGISNVKATPSFSIGEMKVTGIEGKVKKVIDEIKDTEISLGDLPDFLKGESVNLDLQNASISLKTLNKLEIPVDVDMSIIPEKGGKEGTKVNAKFTIKGATSANPKNDSTFVLITNTPRTLAGYTVVVVPELPALISKIPDKLKIKMKATAETPTSQAIQLGTEERVMDFCYDVVVPFDFGDNLHIEYKYTTAVKDLQRDIADIIAQVKEFTIMINVDNTVPIDLQLSLIPVDKDRKEIKGIKLTTGKILGGIDDKPTSSAFYITLKSENNALQHLDGLDLVVTGMKGTNSTINGRSLKPSQYVKVTSMKIKIPGGINVDINKLK